MTARSETLPTRRTQWPPPSCPRSVLRRKPRSHPQHSEHHLSSNLAPFPIHHHVRTPILGGQKTAPQQEQFQSPLPQEKATLGIEHNSRGRLHRPDGLGI